MSHFCHYLKHYIIFPLKNVKFQYWLNMCMFRWWPTCTSRPALLCSPQWWTSLSSVQWTFCLIWHNKSHLERYEWTFSVWGDEDKHKHTGYKYNKFIHFRFFSQNWQTCCIYFQIITFCGISTGKSC